MNYSTSPRKFTQTLKENRIAFLDVAKSQTLTDFKVFPADTYPPRIVSAVGTFDINYFLCKDVWTFAFIFVCFICFTSVVKVWDFCVPCVIAGFIVGKGERIEGKLKAFRSVVQEFNQRLTRANAKGITLCPKCFSDNVIRKGRPKLEIGKLGKLKCKDCGHVYRMEKLPLSVEAPARIVNQVIELTVLGLRTKDVHRVVLRTAQDYGFRYNLARTTIYNIRKNVVEALKHLDRFIVEGVLEGIACNRLECDETFHSKKQSKKLREYFEGGSGVKPPRFIYVINGVSTENRYPLPPEIAEARNKNAFTSFVLRISPYLAHEPKIINCDELRPLMSALKLRFSESELDTTKRTEYGKTMKGKTAHIERLHRMYRKALPKRVKVWNKSVTYCKVNLCRLLNIYLRKHETLGKRVVEALGIPWPTAIVTVSDLIYFAKYIQKNADIVLGDEIKVFNNPILGRMVITINIPTDVYSLIKPKIGSDLWVVIGLNDWAPYSERLKLVKSLVNGEIILHEPSGFLCNIGIRTKLNIYLMRVLFEDNCIHLVGDMLAGPYMMVVPLIDPNIRSLVLGKVWVNPGKVNHYVFNLTREDILRQVELSIKNRLLNELLNPHELKPAYALWENVVFASRSNMDKILCAKEVKVPAQDWLDKLSGVIDVLKIVAEQFDAFHLLHIAVWVANETLIRLPRPRNIADLDSDNVEFLLAALYKVLSEILGVGFSDYCNVVEKLGVVIAKVEGFVDHISLQNFEGLFARLFNIKTPLDFNVEAYLGGELSLLSPASI